MKEFKLTSKQTNLGDKLFIKKPFFIQKIDELELPKGFPLCCESHRRDFYELINWYEKFPNCCKQHKKLAKHPKYNKEMFYGSPYRTVSNYVFTINVIDKYINTDEFLKKFIDIFSVVIDSYGITFVNYAMVGYEKYCQYLEKYLTDKGKNNSRYLEIKKSLEDFHLQQNTPASNSLEKFTEIYNNWLKSLPIKHPFLEEVFKEIEEYEVCFFNIWGINSYTNLPQVGMITERQLLQLLSELSTYILTRCGVRLYYDDKKLPNKNIIERDEIELWKQKCKLETESLNNLAKENKFTHIQIIEKWFEQQENGFEFLFKILKQSPTKLKEERTLLNLLNDDVNLYESIIDTLKIKTLVNPILNDDNHLVGDTKGALCKWFKVVCSNFSSENLTQDDCCQILINTFPSVDKLDKSYFSKPNQVFSDNEDDILSALNVLKN